MMMKMIDDKLVPGDLAVVIKSVRGISIGRIVECIKIEAVTEKYGTVWLVSFVSTRNQGIGAETCRCSGMQVILCV